LIPVSGVVISKNEEDRIASCLESLSFCDELLVLDSGSTDRTREIAEAHGARVEQQDFLGHSRQKHRAAELATHDWIFSLDCDERATPELRQRLENALREPPQGLAGYTVQRKNRYLGRWMRHGMFWPDRKLRVFDRRHCQWGGVDPHDRVELHGEGKIVDLDAAILHDSYRSFDEHRRTVAGFADIAAQAMFDRGKRAGPLSPWTHGISAFAQGWLLKLGLLDGWRGFVAAWMSGRYNVRKYRKLRSLQRLSEQ